MQLKIRYAKAISNNMFKPNLLQRLLKSNFPLKIK